MGILSRNVSYIGLDIGATKLRLVQLKKTGGHPALEAFGSLDMPAGLAHSDAAADRDKIAGLVKELLKSSGASAKSVVMGLPADKVFATVITTPKLSPAELAKSIKYQADQYVPMAIDQVKLDWALLGPGANDQELEVLLVAVPNSITTKYLEIAEKSGLEVLALEVNAVAVERAVNKISGSAVVILDIGTISTDLSVIYNNTPRLIRSIPVGGTTFVKSVAQGLGLDDAQAEQFTFKFGMTQNKLEGQVYKAIKPNFDLLNSEIEKSTKFFNGRYPNVKLEKIILSGGPAALPEFAVNLANATGLPVESANAWTNIAYPNRLQNDLMANAGMFSAAAGLALREYVA